MLKVQDVLVAVFAENMLRRNVAIWPAGVDNTPPVEQFPYILWTVQDDEVRRSDFKADNVSVRLGPFVELEEGLLERDLVKVSKTEKGWGPWWKPFRAAS